MPRVVGSFKLIPRGEKAPVNAKAEILDETGVRRALVRIVAGSSDHGLLAVFCPAHALTETDIHMLERAAAVAALAITKEHAVAAAAR